MSSESEIWCDRLSVSCLAQRREVARRSKLTSNHFLLPSWKDAFNTKSDNLNSGIADQNKTLFSLVSAQKCCPIHLTCAAARKFKTVGEGDVDQHTLGTLDYPAVSLIFDDGEERHSTALLRDEKFYYLKQVGYRRSRLNMLLLEFDSIPRMLMQEA